MPRNTDRPAYRVEDIHAMIDFLETFPGVDAKRIGSLGICGGGGYTIEAAKTDKRMKAVATINMFNTGRLVPGWGRILRDDSLPPECPEPLHDQQPHVLDGLGRRRPGRVN